MKNFAIALIMLFTLNGCVSSMAKEATQSAIDEAGKQVRLKWSEEWKPALIAEASLLAQQAKDEAFKSAVVKLESYEGRLEKIDVKVEEFDTNKDGQVSGVETLALLKEIKTKNDNSKDPMEWWEILLAVGAAYIPLTGAKELAKKKMGTGDGTGTA